MTIQCLGSPSGSSASTCGYCSPPGQRSEEESSYHVAGLHATALSCEIYQKMIDRGWRRSGTWCYKPNLKASCCPQYTIKLDARIFKASKSQRKLVNRWNRYVMLGKAGEAMDVETEAKTSAPRPPKPRKGHSFSLYKSIHESELGFIDPKETSLHTFETTIEPSSYSEEKYDLFKKYQSTIHHDESTERGFKRFLVDSPLIEERIPYTELRPGHLPDNYGSYHQLYKLDGKLIAMGVIDVLPNCVSSVYFMYDVDWEEFSLGKLSALREISLVREMQEAGAPDMSYLYMGFYIHSCQKMRYKGEYSPSYLADPETYQWFPISTCLPLLDKHRYACFSSPQHSLVGPPDSETIDDAVKPPPPLDEEVLEHIRVVSRVRDGKIYTLPVNLSPYWEYDAFREGLLSCVQGLGIDVAKKIIFYL